MVTVRSASRRLTRPGSLLACSDWSAPMLRTVEVALYPAMLPNRPCASASACRGNACSRISMSISAGRAFAVRFSFDGYCCRSAPAVGGLEARVWRYACRATVRPIHERHVRRAADLVCGIAVLVAVRPIDAGSEAVVLPVVRDARRVLDAVDVVRAALQAALHEPRQAHLHRRVIALLVGEARCADGEPVGLSLARNNYEHPAREEAPHHALIIVPSSRAALRHLGYPIG